MSEFKDILGNLNALKIVAVQFLLAVPDFRVSLGFDRVLFKVKVIWVWLKLCYVIRNILNAVLVNWLDFFMSGSDGQFWRIKALLSKNIQLVIVLFIKNYYWKFLHLLSSVSVGYLLVLDLNFFYLLSNLFILFTFKAALPFVLDEVVILVFVSLVVHKPLKQFDIFRALVHLKRFGQTQSVLLFPRLVGLVVAVHFFSLINFIIVLLQKMVFWLKVLFYALNAPLFDKFFL